MTIEEAKAVLLLYRSGVDEPPDPEVRAALQRVEEDPVLGEWWEQQRHFQEVTRQKFQDLQPPPDLKDRLLADHKIVRVPWWGGFRAWGVTAAAAAVVVLLFSLEALYRSGEGERFADYRGRMVRTVLREYRMDVVTNDLGAIRQFLAAHDAPADYELPAGLKQARATGAGVLSWHGKPVSMVCFDRGTNDMLFLFVIDQQAVKHAPPVPGTDYVRVKKLVTANWTRGSKAYVLAGHGEENGLRRYVEP